MADDRDDRFWLWIIFRVISSIIIVSIIFGILFSSVFNRPFSSYPEWVWNLVGLLAFVWFLSWILRPWHFRYWEHGHEMRILRRRYARGEISEAQFKRMMKVLREEDSKHRR